MERLWIDAVEFAAYGGWQKETQFVREMGQPYLVANDIPGEPVRNATTKFSVSEGGVYRVFVRTKNWHTPSSPGVFCVAVDQKEGDALCGAMKNPDWYWEIAGDFWLDAGAHTLALCDKTGWLSRCAAVVVTNDMDFTPTPELAGLLSQRAAIKGISTRTRSMGEWDLVVVGAGPGGVPAAIAAARQGLRTALISDRPFVGGNAADEGTVGLDGAGAKHEGWHETGIANEIKREKEQFGISFGAAMQRLVEKEPLLTLFSDMLCTGAHTKQGKIDKIDTVSTLNLKKYCFRAPLFIDATGDGWLGYYAGACYRLGREGAHEHNEEFAPAEGDTLTMSGCLTAKVPERDVIRSFFLEKGEEACAFTPPDFAVTLPRGEALARTPKSLETAEWWLENSNDYDDLWHREYARDELIRLSVGYVDWLKNSSPRKEELTHHRLKRLALYLAGRESRRIVGDAVLTQGDLAAGRAFEDAISYHGWGIDLHHLRGIYSGKEGPFFQNSRVPIGTVPFGCLVARGLENLMVASRCASFTHLALGSTRVESTLATLGQAAGTAAALCKKYGISPREVGKCHIKELQQRLLRDDQTIPGVKNCDEADLAKAATVTADSEKQGWEAPLVINGVARSFEGQNNAWRSAGTLPQALALDFQSPITVSVLQATTETDLTYPRFSYQQVPPHTRTVADMTVELFFGGACVARAEIRGNYKRQMRLFFDRVRADRIVLTVTRAEGDEAVLCEVRVYE